MKLAELVSKRVRVIPSESAECIAPCAIQVGIELEVSGCTKIPESIATVWGSHVDSSVRDNPMEFTSAGGRSTEDAFNDLRLWYANKPRSWYASSRCGLHIHVDCMDLTVEQFGMFMLLSLAADEDLFDMTGSSYRKGATFCRLSSSQSHHIAVTSFALKGEYQRLQSKLLAGVQSNGGAGKYKYSSINLSRMPSIGTVEFRHFAMQEGAEDVIRIINLLSVIRKAALTGDLTQYKETFNAAHLEQFKNMFGVK